MKYYLHVPSGVALSNERESSRQLIHHYPNSFVEISKDAFEEIKTEAGWKEKDLRKTVIDVTFDRRNHFSKENKERLKKKGIILLFPGFKS